MQPHNRQQIAPHQSRPLQTNPEQPLENSLCIGIVGITGGFLMNLVLGSLFQWGIINIYVTSYFKALYEPSVSIESNAIAFPIMMICIGLTFPLGLFLSKISHPVLVLALNAVGMAAVVFASSYVHNMVGFIILYGVVFGFLAGNSAMIPLLQCGLYFPKHKLITTGILLMGNGLGSLVFGLFSYNCINPDQIRPVGGYYTTTEIISEVPVCLRFLSLIYLLLGVIGVAMISPVCIINLRPPQTPPNQQASPLKVSGQATVCEALQSKLLWIQASILFLGSCGIFLLNGNYKTYVKNSIDDDALLTLAGSLGGAANGTSRFLWSLYLRKTGYKSVILTLIAVGVVIYTTLRYTVSLPNVYVFMIILVNCCVGGFMVLGPSISQELFGIQTGLKLFMVFWESVALANLTSFFFVNYLSTTIGFDWVIYICLIMALFSVPLIILTTFQGQWQNSLRHLEYCIQDDAAQAPQMDLMEPQIELVTRHLKVSELPPLSKVSELPSLSKVPMVDENTRSNLIQ